jgi:hypothetical protein
VHLESALPAEVSSAVPADVERTVAHLVVLARLRLRGLQRDRVNDATISEWPGDLAAAANNCRSRGGGGEEAVRVGMVFHESEVAGEGGAPQRRKAEAMNASSFVLKDAGAHAESSSCLPWPDDGTTTSRFRFEAEGGKEIAPTGGGGATHPVSRPGFQHRLMERIGARAQPERRLAVPTHVRWPRCRCCIASFRDFLFLNTYFSPLGGYRFSIIDSRASSQSSAVPDCISSLLCES